MTSRDFHGAGWVLVALLASGCGGGGGGGGGGGEPRSHFVIVGYYEPSLSSTAPCYWTDRSLEAVPLPLPEGATGGSAVAVAVDGETVTIVGNAKLDGGDWVPAYWTGAAGGTFTAALAPLPAGATEGGLSAVAVQGGRARAAGTYSDSTGHAAYWSDLAAAPLTLPVPAGADGASASALAVDGDRVYVGGDYTDAYHDRRPYAWKDGAALSPAPLARATDWMSQINAIGVTADHQVVLAGICGDAEPAGCVWTAGGAQEPTVVDGGASSVEIWAVAVSGSDVHLAGYGNKDAAYWSSTAATSRALARPSEPTVGWSYGIAYAAAVVNGTVQLVGAWGGEVGGTWPCAWAGPDGAATPLHVPAGAKGGEAWGIAAAP